MNLGSSIALWLNGMPNCTIVCIKRSSVGKKTKSSIWFKKKTQQPTNELQLKRFKVHCDAAGSGSLASRSSSSKPVKTTESVSLGINLRSAEGTRSSSCRVRARSPGFGKCGTTRGLGMAGEMSSNSKPCCFRADVTNCNNKGQHTLVGSYKTVIDRLYCKKIGKTSNDIARVLYSSFPYSTQ